MRAIRIPLLAVAILCASCDDGLLDEQVYSVLGPTSFFNTQEDAVAFLNSIYSVEQLWVTEDYAMTYEAPTDMMVARFGVLAARTRPLEDFNWDPTHQYLDRAWKEAYEVIYRANLLIERAAGMSIPEAPKQLVIAEARFLRAEAYMLLYDFFGPPPLITSSDVDPASRPTRATEAAIEKFVEDELRAAATALPRVAPQYGRATKGAALGFLARFHLNNHKWQPAADVSKEIMDLGQYSLFNATRRSELFRLENDRNSEFIYVSPFITNVRGNGILSHWAPADYKWKGLPKHKGAVELKLLAGFTDTFHPDDQRQDVILKEYENKQGRLIKLARGDFRSFKYEEDLNATNQGNGNDFPRIRYADVLLMRAEALNEISGPNAESISLINQVRSKAGVPLLTAAQFGSRQALRDHILAERSWEFFQEGLRRSDLIRHDKFVSSARARGKNAESYRNLYPIPQTEMDKNPSLQQNPGY